MKVLVRIASWFDVVSEWTGRLAQWLVMLVIAVGFYNVIARYLGKFVGQRLTSNTAIELQWYIYSLIYFLAFAYILKHNVNVRVDILYVKWSPKRRALVDLVGTVLFLIPFCLIGINGTIDPVLQSWGRLPDGSFGRWELSPDPDGLPRAPIKSMIIVAFLLLLLGSISHALKSVAILLGHEEVAIAAAEEFQPTTPLAIEQAIEHALE